MAAWALVLSLQVRRGHSGSLGPGPQFAGEGGHSGGLGPGLSLQVRGDTVAVWALVLSLKLGYGGVVTTQAIASISW